MDKIFRETINIEIAYATCDKQVLKSIAVPADYTVEQAILASDILAEFPEINLAVNNIGIFSKKVTLNTVLQMGDRIEIYRPLVIDPKQARRIRAKRKKESP